MIDRKYRFRLRFLLQEIDLFEGVFVIGRSPDNNLTLKDPLVSRRHARISIMEDSATLDDLGSRNGTLVNGEPVFDNRRLWHSDVIRIGAHSIEFVRKRAYPMGGRALPQTDAICSECKEPFGDGKASCPKCSTPLVPDNCCRQCHATLTDDASYCHKCGSSIGRDDSTIPVELGGERSGWTPEIIDDVIRKALDVGRFEQAAKLLDGRVEDFEAHLPMAPQRLEELKTLSEFNLKIARELKNPNRLAWVIRRFTNAPFPMPISIVKNLETAASGWYDIHGDLLEYLKKLESRSGQGAIDSDSIDSLRVLIDERR